jgi:hypothetical protein
MWCLEGVALTLAEHVDCFFSKEYILISRRYPLFLASATTEFPNNITNAHIKKRITEKSPAIVIYSLKQQYKHHQDSIRSPTSPTATPSRRKRCTSGCRRPIIDHRFSPWRSPCSQNNAFNKDISRHNQWRPEFEFSPYKVGLWTSPVLSPQLANAAAMSHRSPSKFLIATKTQITIAIHQKLGFHQEHDTPTGLTMTWIKQIFALAREEP